MVLNYFKSILLSSLSKPGIRPSLHTMASSNGSDVCERALLNAIDHTCNASDMDEKDPLVLHVVEHNEVDGQMSLLPSTSGMEMRMPAVHSIAVPSCDAQDEDSQKCIVVVPVEQYEPGQVIGKSLDLGDPSDCSSASGLMGINEEPPKESQASDPVTQSWFTTKFSKDSLSEQGHKWKQGMWSRDEIDLLESNIDDYLREHKLSDVSEVIFNNSKDNRKNFYRKIAQGLQRPLFAVYRRVIRMYDHKNHMGRYSAEDIKKLKELRAKHGNDWAFIGSEMGRSASSVKDKFRLLKDSCNKGKWSVQEETLLANTVFALTGSHPGDSVTTGISWSQVAEQMGTRTEKQCRAKWLNYLNWKQTGGSDWNRNDDLILINRIGEMEVDVETDLDWGAIAKNWKSVRSPQWLRSKWWSLKRQVPLYESLPIKTLLEHLKVMHGRRLRDERSMVSSVSLDSQANQLKNSTVTVQVPIHIGHGGNLETSEGSSLQSLMLPQSALASLSTTGAFLMGHNLTTVHEDNHIIIQVTNVPGSGGETVGPDGTTKQIIITARQPRQAVPSLGHDETVICEDDIHVQQSSADLSNESSPIVHSGDDHMTAGIGQSQVSVVGEQPISSEAQLIGTDAVLPQQSVPNNELVVGAEQETTLVVVNSAPSTEELSQPTTGTVEESQLGGGVFTLAGPLPVLQTQGDEHALMGSPGHLDTLQHHHDDEEEAEHVSLEVVKEGVEEHVEEVEKRSRPRKRKRSRNR